MKLSVIIVNYNVEHFLEQCLLSVEKAVVGIDAEVWVIDNASVDGSCRMVKEKFPWVKLVENRENVGFSRANNQAMRASEAKYQLLLNPDTVVEEDTFRRCIEFMDAHPKAGGLGVRMVDGKGKFLPESKRGLPTPWVAFCKISGIYRLFKRSKRFNHYYMGYLDEHETGQVEILSGAFMMMRKEVLDQVGLLDEAFFMYGEDIDLSWRIVLGGSENYYFPETRIIHYKGESTKKGSLNYVFVFYNAMVIFARKHFSERNARVFSSLINLAIWARASVAVLQRFVQRVWLSALDGIVLFAALWLLQEQYALWQHKIYDRELMQWAFMAYTAVWMLSVFFSGGYDRPISAMRMLRGTVIGSVIILLGYALLPEDLRFSRALILLGSVATMMWYLMSRMVLSWVSPEAFRFAGRGHKKFAVIGHLDEVERIEQLLYQTLPHQPEVTAVSIDEHRAEAFAGSLDQLNEIIRVYRIDQIIFSGRDLSAARIIDLMIRTTGSGIDYKIAPPDSLYMIGSNSIDTGGELFMLETNGVHKPSNRRNKRFFDLASALMLIITLPLNFWFVQCKWGYIRNLFKVLFGERSWVGYAGRKQGDVRLPSVTSGVLTPATGARIAAGDDETLQKLNIIYARNYRLRNDVALLFRHFHLLGNE